MTALCCGCEGVMRLTSQHPLVSHSSNPTSTACDVPPLGRVSQVYGEEDVGRALPGGSKVRSMGTRLVVEVTHTTADAPPGGALIVRAFPSTGRTHQVRFVRQPVPSNSFSTTVCLWGDKNSPGAPSMCLSRPTTSVHH